jgi:hypothetical protein
VVRAGRRRVASRWFNADVGDSAPIEVRVWEGGGFLDVSHRGGRGAGTGGGWWCGGAMRRRGCDLGRGWPVRGTGVAELSRPAGEGEEEAREEEEGETMAVADV